ncbi:MAG: SpoIIE family protein phosphatase [Bacteroidetes bacterium]|nr:SpoIIE family protein phosphatase [Bacteroidota bacterium]
MNITYFSTGEGTWIVTHLLVVDDEPDLELLIRQRFRRKIREGEYEFAFAANGKEALGMVERMPHLDVVLCDINMPVMDGLTFLSRVAERGGGDFKTIIVSAYGDMQNIRTAMNRGAFDFVTKPIDFEDLELTIEKTARQVLTLREARETDQKLQILHRELEVANRVQQEIIPKHFPAFPEHQEFSLFAAMHSASSVGGDFYDFFKIGDHALGVAVADVSGKGVPAALIMAASRSLLKSQALQGTAPAECLAQVNRSLCSENLSSMFVSLFYGVLDIRSGAFTYSSAGHNPPFKIDREAAAHLDPVKGTVLGVDAGFTYRENTVTLHPGERLLIYTDGIVEAFNQEREEYSDARLQQLLTEDRPPGVEALVSRVLEDVRSHAGGMVQSDDMTVLALEYHGSTNE